MSNTYVVDVSESSESEAIETPYYEKCNKLT